MEVEKYKLWEIARFAASGETDLKDGVGKIVDINGCTLLRCTRVAAEVSFDFRRYRLSPGRLLVLMGDLPFIPIEVSPDFHACYISVSVELADEMFYKVTSSL